MFGGNSNWRGPIWMPINYLVLRNLQRYALSLGDDVRIEYPTGSGRSVPLSECAEDLRRRLISIFLRDGDGRRPCHGGVEKLQTDPRWREHITFNEYFHGDNGAGLGAAHQMGGPVRGRPDRAERRRSAGSCWPGRERDAMPFARVVGLAGRPPGGFELD